MGQTIYPNFDQFYGRNKEVKTCQGHKTKLMAELELPQGLPASNPGGSFPKFRFDTSSPAELFLFYPKHENIGGETKAVILLQPADKRNKESASTVILH